MVDETKNCVFEGASVWCKSDEYDAIWRSSKILDVGIVNESNGKIDIQVELEDGERTTIKTKLEENKIDEYQNIKPRNTLNPPTLYNYDLSTLPIINEPEILERIRLCNSKNIRYLSIGPILLYLRRFETIPSLFNPSIYKNYFLVDDIRHDILNPLTSNITQLVNQIHLKVSQTVNSNSFRSTQAIIMLGESGAGKSKCAKDICSHLAYLASTTVRKNTQTYIPDVKLFESIHCILDSFGHAQTTRNPHSSRYSKAIKISYDDDTSLIKGILYRCFHLETNRVVHQLNGESNYRVFYEVFDDIYFAAQAMSKYGIDNLTMFRYTSKRPNSTFQPGKSSYKDLSAALESVANLPKAKQNTSIFGLLAAILHLGELEFDVIDNYGDINTVLSADPVSIDRQNRVLSLLGISIDTLLSTITKKNLNFAGNIVEKNLDFNESIIARDALACQLYSSLFRWIVSKTNEGIASKFPSLPNRAVSHLFKDPINETIPTSSLPSTPLSTSSTSPLASTSPSTSSSIPTPSIPQNSLYLYDLTGFENIETNGLEQLCINYSNERIFQFLNQIIYILHKELYINENLLNLSTFPPPQTSHDNSLTIRLLENRSNGIFTICDDQLKLKSSTSDEKLATILYTQHGSNKSFLSSKSEQKNYEFLIKHYAVLVRYSVLGFTSSNKLEPTTEILECLKSSSLPFIKGDILSFCDFKILSNASSQSGLSSSVDYTSFKQPSSRNLLDRSPSSRNLDKSPSSRNLNSRNSFDTSDSKRDTFLKQRSFAHSEITPATPSRGLVRAPSLAVRGPTNPPSTPRNAIKVATLASSCSAMMTEIISEAKLCDVTFFMCLKLNDCNDPLKFDQHTVLRQLKPYGITDIISFYHHSYPYHMDHISFVNRYSILSLIYSLNKLNSSNYLIALYECRSHGMDNINEWKELAKELIPMIPSLPELDPLVQTFSNSFSSELEQMKTIRNGIKVGELNVYMTSLSYTYLNSFQSFAIELIKQKIWNFYKNSKTKSRHKAGVVIGSLMLKLLNQTKATKEVKRNSSIILIQAIIRCYLVRRRLRNEKNQQDIAASAAGAGTGTGAAVGTGTGTETRNAEEKQEQHDLSSNHDENNDENFPTEEEVMVSFDFDEVSHNQLTNDVRLEVVESDSMDLNRNEGNVNLEDMSSKEPESIDPTMTTLNHLYARRSHSVSNDDNEEEEVAQIINVDTLDFTPHDGDGNGNGNGRGSGDDDEDASLDPIQLPPQSPPTQQNLLHHFNADRNSNQKDRTLQSSITSPSVNSNGGQNSQPPSLTLAQQTKINDLQSKVDSLEAENSRLRRKLESLSSFVREEEKTPEKPSPSVGYSSDRKKFVNRMSSVTSQMESSVYGGEYSRIIDHWNASTDIRPDYERYVQKTLETLDEDISYLLHGTPFYKFGRSGSVHKTLIHLSTDYRYLYWKPKNSLIKSSDECRVDLRLVWRLVPGQSTPPFQAYKGISHGPMPPKRSFSLIYGFRSLDLCALDDESYDSWFIGLKYVLQLINGELHEAGLDRQQLRKKWNYIDRNNFGFLSRKEIIQLVSALGIQFDRSTFTTALLKSTIGNSTHDEITFSQFDSLVYQLRRRPDLEIIWYKVVTGYDFSKDIIPLQMDGPFESTILQEVIGINTFKEFWKLSQHRLLNDDEAKKMIAEGMGEMHQEEFPVLSFNGFVSIMTHYKNDAYDPIACIHSNKSMTYPLQHYYISSSDGMAVDHPNQEYYNSISLEEGGNRPNSYVIALQNGCRALELRCFEELINPQGEQTDLFVGNARNKERITFKETLLHIHRVAFANTHFPLILLLEISCNVLQQKRAAKLLLKLFGNAIYTPAETQTKLLPSPLDLKNRVLIFLIHRKRDIHTAYRVGSDVVNTKVSSSLQAKDSFHSMHSNQSFDPDKKQKPYKLIQQIHESFDFNEEGPGYGQSRGQGQGQGGQQWQSQEEDDDYDSLSDYGLDPPIYSISPNHRNSRTPRNNYLILDPEAIRKDGTLDKSQMELIQKCDVIHSSLMSLCHYSRNLRIGSHPLRDMLARLADDSQAETSLINFNIKKFTYIYMDQNTKRFGSYGGMVNAWDCGISLVSLCHDYPSLGTKINSGRFRQNGNCGYVLKPERYRTLNIPTPETSPLILTLHLISGKDLPIPKIAENSTTPNSPGGGGGVSPSPPSRSASQLSMKKSTSRIVDHDSKSVERDIIRTNTHDLNSIQDKSSTGRVRNKGFNVVIDLNGATCDDIQNKTRYIKRHGRSPYWNEVFTFSVKDTTQGQLTMRIFYNDICSCYVSIPLRCLRAGYRSVALYEEVEENNFTSSRLNLGSLFIRVRFDELTQYNNLQSLPENMKIMEDTKKSNIRRLNSNMSSRGGPGGGITTPATAPGRKEYEKKEHDYRRSRSEGRSTKREKNETERRTQSRTSTRGIVSYDSTPIIIEGDNERESIPHRKSGILDVDMSAPSRVRSRRETKPRRKSEASFEVSEEMLSHYNNTEERQSTFNYQDVIEAEKEQNAKKLTLKRLSQQPPQQQQQSQSQPQSQSQQQETKSEPTATHSPQTPSQPPPPPPRKKLVKEPEVQTNKQSNASNNNDEEHLPSYNSAVNLIELREQQNARNVCKFEVDSGDEATPNRPSEQSVDPWTPPV